MPYCKVNKANIYYEVMGEGIPILMIHGYTPDHVLMTGCMEPIFKQKEGWQRIYIDLPGMGITKSYEDISCSDEMLDAVLEFIDLLIPDKKYLVAGESYGGYIARGIIAKRSECILGSAFICPLIIPDAEIRQTEEHQVMKVDREFMNDLTQEEQEEFRLNSVILDEYNWSRYNKDIKSGIALADMEFLQKLKQNYAFSFEIDQSAYSNPALFLLGRQDSIVGYKDALALMNMYPRGSFAVLDSAGHNLQIEQPDIFNSLMEGWLNKVSKYQKEDK